MHGYGTLALLLLLNLSEDIHRAAVHTIESILLILLRVTSDRHRCIHQLDSTRTSEMNPNNSNRPNHPLQEPLLSSEYESHHQQEERRHLNGQEEAAPVVIETRSGPSSSPQDLDGSLSTKANTITSIPTPPLATEQPGPGLVSPDNDSDSLLEAVLTNGRLVSETYYNLSLFQWGLLIATTIQAFLIRVLVHLQVILHQYEHMDRRRLHAFNFFLDVLRLVVCVVLEIWEQAKQEFQQNRLRTLPASWSSLSSLWSTATSLLYQSLALNFVQNYKDALKPAVVVLLTLIERHAIYQSFYYLPFFVAELSLQGVLVGVACLCTIVFQYRFTRHQWLCLCSSLIGTLLANPVHGGVRRYGSWLKIVVTGLSWVLLSIAAGAGAAVYWERILKQDLALARASPPSASLWMRSIQYSVYAGLINLVQTIWTPKSIPFDEEDDESESEQTDETSSVILWRCFFVPLLSMGTVLMMATLKYVTALHDKLCLVLAYALSTVLTFWFWGYETTSTGTMYVSVATVLISTYFFGVAWPPSCPPQRPPVPSTATSQTPPQPPQRQWVDAGQRQQGYDPAGIATTFAVERGDFAGSQVLPTNGPVYQPVAVVSDETVAVEGGGDKEDAATEIGNVANGTP